MCVIEYYEIPCDLTLNFYWNWSYVHKCLWERRGANLEWEMKKRVFDKCVFFVTFDKCIWTRSISILLLNINKI